MYMPIKQCTRFTRVILTIASERKIVVIRYSYTLNRILDRKIRVQTQLIRVEGCMLTIVVIMFVIRVYTLGVQGYEKLVYRLIQCSSPRKSLVKGERFIRGRRETRLEDSFFDWSSVQFVSDHNWLEFIRYLR